MKIIVGLGNPGDKYASTRHNVGFMALDALAQKNNLSWQVNKKFKAEFTKNNDLILIKPTTYMNNSGQAVSAVLSYYKLLPKILGIINKKNSDLSSILTVLHDDIDIDLGKYKIVTDSRSAGHNGVQSIMNQLKTKTFKRVRIGIRTEMREKIPAQKFVLQKFGEKEKEIINQITPEILNSV